MNPTESTWAEVARRKPGHLWLVLAVVLSLSACSGSSTTAHSGSATNTSLPASLTPTGQSAPLGSVLVAKAGHGPAAFELPTFAVGHSHMSVRLSCVGPGTVLMTDRQGGSVLHTLGCSSHAIYGSDFTSSSADDEVKLVVDKSVAWNIGIWQSQT